MHIKPEFAPDRWCGSHLVRWTRPSVKLVNSTNHRFRTHKIGGDVGYQNPNLCALRMPEGICSFFRWNVSCGASERVAERAFCSVKCRFSSLLGLLPEALKTHGTLRVNRETAVWHLTCCIAINVRTFRWYVSGFTMRRE